MAVRLACLFAAVALCAGAVPALAQSRDDGPPPALPPLPEGAWHEGHRPSDGPPPPESHDRAQHGERFHGRPPMDEREWRGPPVSRLDGGPIMAPPPGEGPLPGGPYPYPGWVYPPVVWVKVPIIHERVRDEVVEEKVITTTTTTIAGVPHRHRPIRHRATKWVKYSR